MVSREHTGGRAEVADKVGTGRDEREGERAQRVCPDL